MDPERFDNLVRSLFSRGSRRRALATVLGGAGSLLGVTAAIAGNKGKDTCKKGEKPCGKKCYDTELEECCKGKVCNALKERCCKGTCCKGICCKGKKCCKPGEGCEGSKADPKCCPAARECGGGCCPNGTDCCPDKVNCCAPGLVCSPPVEEGEIGDCCEPNQVPCAGGCCNPSSTGKAPYCCPDGKGCCYTGDPCCTTNAGVHYCCSGERGLTCLQSGGPTCQSA